MLWVQGSTSMTDTVVELPEAADSPALRSPSQQPKSGCHVRQAKRLGVVQLTTGILTLLTAVAYLIIRQKTIELPCLRTWYYEYWLNLGPSAVQIALSIPYIVSGAISVRASRSRYRCFLILTSVMAFIAAISAFVCLGFWGGSLLPDMSDFISLRPTPPGPLTTPPINGDRDYDYDYNNYRGKREVYRLQAQKQLNTRVTTDDEVAEWLRASTASINMKTDEPSVEYDTTPPSAYAFTTMYNDEYPDEYYDDGLHPKYPTSAPRTIPPWVRKQYNSALKCAENEQWGSFIIAHVVLMSLIGLFSLAELVASIWLAVVMIKFLCEPCLCKVYFPKCWAWCFNEFVKAADSSECLALDRDRRVLLNNSDVTEGTSADKI